MARSYIEYSGDGSTTNFAVPFPYIDESHVKCAVDGEDTSFTWINSGTIAISPAPTSGAFIKIYRETSYDERLVDYNVPGTLTEEDLDNDSLQAFYMAQEAVDTAEAAMVPSLESGHWDGQGKRVTNIARAEQATDAVTKADLDAAALAPVTPLAENISFTPSGSGLSATTVQAAIIELDTNIDTVASERIPKSIIDAKGDLIVGTANNTSVRKAVGSNGHVLTADSTKTDGLDWKEVPLPRSYLAGFTLANNASDATNDIDIAAGAARDSTNAANLIGAAMTKRLDAAWAAGTNQGGLDTGSVADGTYHVFAIRKDSDGSVDYLFSASPTAPTMPTGYTYFRRIGSILRESGSIVAFKQMGDEFLRAAIANQESATVSGTAQLMTLAVPTGLQVTALIRCRATDATGNVSVLITSPDESDQAASANGAASVLVAANGQHHAGHIAVRTNTSAQVRARSNDTQTTVALGVYGWIDRRGRDD